MKMRSARVLLFSFFFCCSAVAASGAIDWREYVTRADPLWNISSPTELVSLSLRHVFMTCI